MNTDIRIAVSFRGHRKRKRLRLLLGPGSTDYLLDLWLSTAMNHPSGVLLDMDATDIALEAGWEDDPDKFVSALIECGFLDQREDGVFALHDWEDHQSYVTKAPERRAAAKHAAGKRWEAKRNADSCGGHAEGMPVAMRNDEKGNAPLPSPSPSPKALREDSSLRSESLSPGVETPTDESPADLLENFGSEIEPKKNSPPTCPHERIIALYHEVLPELARVKTWGKHREGLLRARWRETWERLRKGGHDHDLNALLEWWRKYFATVRTYPWLMGQKTDRDGRSFYATLEWLVRPKNYAKVLEGFYVERRRQA